MRGQVGRWGLRDKWGQENSIPRRKKNGFCRAAMVFGWVHPAVNPVILGFVFQVGGTKNDSKILKNNASNKGAGGVNGIFLILEIFFL